MLLLLACAAPPPSREEVRAACGLGAEDAIALAWSEEDAAPPSMKEGCAAALADAFHVDWDTFGVTAADAADPSDPTARLFGGLYTLLAADLGTIGELDTASGFGSASSVDDVSAGLLAELGDDDPATHFYWSYATGVFEETRMVDDADCTLASLPYGSLLVCAPWLYGDTDSESALVSRANPAVAATVVHEAFHQARSVPTHLHEDGCEYDAGPDAAYGMGARWLWAWSRLNAGRVSARDAHLAAIARQTECVHIADREGFVPCEGSLEVLCDPAASYTPIPDP